MIELRGRPGLASTRAELRLVVNWARRDVAARFRQSTFQAAWALLQPASVVLVYVLVFREILRVESSDAPYISFILVGLVMWRYIAIGLSQATCFIDQADVMRKVYFRREVIPLSACAAGLVELGVGTVAVVIVAAFQGVTPGVTLLALPIVYLALIQYTVATAILIATVTVFIRDVAHALPTLMQLFFLATPVMYPPSQYPPGLQFLKANPLAVLMEAARDCILMNRWPSALGLATNVVLSALFLAGAAAYLRSIEHRIVDVV